jgi:hypothetical protein
MKRVTVSATVGMVVLCAAYAQATPVLTQRGDSNRSGVDSTETVLTPSSVSAQSTTTPGVTSFGLGYTLPVNGELYAQPLIAEKVPVLVGGVPTNENLLILADYENNVYAYDATASNPPVLYWSANFGTPVPGGITSSTNPDSPQCSATDIDSYIGIISTPVIDASTNTMYFVHRNFNNTDTSYHQYLHALDITKGLDKPGSPVEIVAANTAITSGSQAFDPKRNNQRAGLLLQNGNVYITWSSHNDCTPYHGWVMSYAYNGTGFVQNGTWVDTPGGSQAGIWMNGGGLVGDGTNVYLNTGNGSFDAQNGGHDYGESVVGLVGTFGQNWNQVTSWFTPTNWSNLNRQDKDVSGSGMLLIPATYPNTNNVNILVSGDKAGDLFLVNALNMGGFNKRNSPNIQTLSTGNNQIHGAPLFLNSSTAGQLVFVWPSGDHLKAYKLSNGKLNTTAVWQSSFSAPSGEQTSAGLWLSENGNPSSGTAVLWATVSAGADAIHGVQPGVLYAFNAETGALLYSSVTDSTRDNYGSFAKDPPPIVWNGRVYVPTFNSKGNSSGGACAVYGLFY